MVTVTAKNNDVDAADKTVTVSGTAQNARAADDSMTVAVTPAELTITDDDEKGFAFAPAEFIEVTEGGAPVAYTVALTSEPDGAVAVAVAAEGNAFLSISPPSLTFTAADWKQAQTVTVTAQDDGNDVAESSSVSHTASGGGYGGVSGSLPVSVEGETRVRVGGASGTRTYRIAGRQVVVQVVVKDTAGVPEGIEVDLAGLASGPPLTLTFGPPDDNVPMESDRFSLGPEGSRTVVDIAASEMLSVEVCLPVEDGLSAEAGDRTLLLLHHDGSAWGVGPRSGGDLWRDNGLRFHGDVVLAVCGGLRGYEAGVRRLLHHLPGVHGGRGHRSDDAASGEGGDGRPAGDLRAHAGGVTAVRPVLRSRRDRRVQEGAHPVRDADGSGGDAEDLQMDRGGPRRRQDGAAGGLHDRGGRGQGEGAGASGANQPFDPAGGVAGVVG